MTFHTPEIGEILHKAFDYDHWANMRWYNALRLMKNQETASPVLQHILTTQRIWLERCGVDVSDIPRAATLSAFESVTKAWHEVLNARKLDEEIPYTDSRARAHRRRLGEIAWHVINHGTFHRGHLRGLAQGEGFEEFTDTDLIYYLDETRKG